MQDISGIIGTVAGSISTLIATQILKRQGRLHLYIVDHNYTFTLYGEGVYMGGKDDGEICSFHYNYIIEIYNGSDTAQIMRDFQVAFYKENREVIVSTPDDDDTKQCSRAGCYWDKAQGICIKPKEILQISQCVSYNDNEAEKIVNCNKVELQYQNCRNHKKRIIISDENIIVDSTEHPILSQKK